MANLPAGTSVEASSGYQTDVGWDIDYSITETRPQTPAIVNHFTAQVDTDHRVVSLEFDRSSLVVHAVTAVRVLAHPHSVRPTPIQSGGHE